MNKNRIGLTCISFLSYSFTGALITVTGIIMGHIAKDFRINLTDMSNTFTFLNSGILVAMLVNNWFIKKFPVKKQLFISFFFTLSSILGLVFIHKKIVFCCSMFTLGCVSGLTMSIGTFIITNLYNGNTRATLLLITDSFFSMAGIFFPFITGMLLVRNVSWHWIYVLIGVIDLIIFLITINVQFPKVKTTQAIKDFTVLSKFGFISVSLLATSAFLYILGQLGFISWVPLFMTKHNNVTMLYSSQLVSNFWMAYMIGMWVFTFFITLFDLQKILILLIGSSTILMYYFINSDNLYLLPWIISALGFFSSAIYTIIITLSSLQKKVSSPKIVNFVLTSGTTGTLLTFVVTSPIVAIGGASAALRTANILYILVGLLQVFVTFFTQHKKNVKYKNYHYNKN